MAPLIRGKEKAVEGQARQSASMPDSARGRSRGLAAAILTCGLVLGYGAFLGLRSNVGFPDGLRTASRLPYLSDKPVGEDGFYMLTVAWNLGAFRGFVYNSDRPTSGVQPLATVVYGSLAYLTRALGGDRWTFIRVVVVFGTLTFVLFAWLMAKVAREIRVCSRAGGADASFAGLWTFIAVASSFFTFRILTYGLETGIYLLLFGTLILVSLRVSVPDLGPLQIFGIGLLVGLTGLARIDFGLIAAAAFLSGFLLAPSWRRNLVLIGSVAFLSVLPWLLWVRRVSGAWMPSSGDAQMAEGVSVARLAAMGAALLQELVPAFHNGGRALPQLFQLVVLAFLVLRVVQGGWQRSLLPVHPAGRIYIGLLSATALLVPTYLFLFASSHFYSRYLAPLLLFSFPATGILLAKISAGKVLRQNLWCGVLLALFASQAIISLHVGRTGNSHSIAAGYVSSALSRARVGAFQSGAIGYFNPNVVNLDGKLDANALAARRRGTLSEFIDSERIEAVIDWPDMIQGFLGDESAISSDWSECPGSVPSTHRCFLRYR